jgi:hypothetical protein
MLVSQKTATRIRQSWRGGAVGELVGGVVGGVVAGTVGH